MKLNRSVAVFLPVLLVMSYTCVAEPLSGDVEAECRQEAEDYDVMLELREEYITGCIDSRGGVVAVTDVEEGIVPSDVAGEENWHDAGGDVVAE